MSSEVIDQCGRITLTGSGNSAQCNRRCRHLGDHIAMWSDRDGRRRPLLIWGFEKDGHAVWENTPGATDVRNYVL